MLATALVLLGAGLLTAVLDAAGLGVGATPAEALMWGAAGVLFARVFSLPVVALAVALLVAGIELGTGGLDGGSPGPADDGDPLSLALPDGRRLEVTEAVFAAAYGWWTLRLGFRREATWLALAAALVLALASADVPALTALAVAFLLPNADRVAPALRGAERPGDAESP